VTAQAAAVLRPGDRVRYDGADHLVVALAGTSVRLRSADGAELVVLAGHLMASPEFTVTGGGTLPEVEPLGLLESLPAGVLEKAREQERHVVEVLTGLSPDPPPGLVPRPGFDPAVATLAERERAKAAELGVTVRTLQARRARYGRQGLWGLVDQRAVRLTAATGRADARTRALTTASSAPRRTRRRPAFANGAKRRSSRRSPRRHRMARTHTRAGPGQARPLNPTPDGLRW